MKILIHALLLLLTVPCNAYQSFETFMEKHDKTYATKEEEDYRRMIYESNLEHIVMHNNDHSTPNRHILGLNHFMDLESHELPLGYDKSLRHGVPAKVGGAVEQKGRRKLFKNHQQHGDTDSSSSSDESSSSDDDDDLPFTIEHDMSTLPPSVDWRFAATPVKDQGMCGSCWAFAAIEALESHLFLTTNQFWTLSVQELVSCAPNPKRCGGAGGCTGATAVQAYDYLMQAGVVSEWNFGYESYHGNNNVSCTLKPRRSDSILAKGAVATLEDYIILPPNNYTVMMNALQLGPLVISVAASSWMFYKSGVFHHDFSNPHDADLNHAVVLYGYGTDQETGEDYWLVRNSWSPTWGEDGYIRLFRQDPATTTDDECSMDITPGDGDACEYDDDGNKVDPLPPQKICGTSGVYTAGYLPMGLKLL